MKILVLGGTRFFGIELVKALLKEGHHITIATRGQTADSYGNQVERIKVDRNNLNSMNQAFVYKEFDVVYDFLAYCSNDVKRALDTIHCHKYILISSTAVYHLHEHTVETDFDPCHHLIKWGERDDFDYDEGKRQAEAVLVQKYPQQNFIIVRFPVVLGQNDYTQRLYFYVKKVYNEQSIFIHNINDQLSFILADDAGQFLAFLVDKSPCQIYNASAPGTISLKEMIQYIEIKTNKQLISYQQGDNAPYNNIPAHSICTDKAQEIGFEFQLLKQGIFPLIDHYIFMLEELQK